MLEYLIGSSFILAGTPKFVIIINANFLIFVNYINKSTVKAITLSQR